MAQQQELVEKTGELEAPTELKTLIEQTLILCNRSSRLSPKSLLNKTDICSADNVVV